MNAEALLEHYDRVADAPDAIPRLRRFILDLAVRGKLVSQDPNDEPAPVLLERIGALSLSRPTRRTQTPSVGGHDVPFSLPPTWTWTRLGNLTSYLQRGKSPQYALSGGSPVVSQKCVQWRGLDLSVAKQVTLESLAGYEEVRFLRKGDLLWNSTGTGTIGRVIRLDEVPERLVCDGHVTVVRCAEVDPEYIRTWLRSDHVYGQIEERAAGATNQVELTSQMAINQIVPLPPLAEQRRIVARVSVCLQLLERWERSLDAELRLRGNLLNALLAHVLDGQVHAKA